MAAQKKTPRQTYYVHNTSRDPKKKDQRLRQVGPDRSRLNIRIAGTMEVRRGRPLPVGDVILRRHLKELIELEEKGLVEVFDYRSQRVDLKKLPPADPAVDPNKAKATATRERREASSLKAPPTPKGEKAEQPPAPPEPPPAPEPEPPAPEPEPEPEPEPPPPPPPEPEPVADTEPPPPPEVEESWDAPEDVPEAAPEPEDTSSPKASGSSRRGKKRRR
jgi:hypothetical protein